jgi:hypothetical protein
MMRTAVRPRGCPVERWCWITGQVSPLNVFAAVSHWSAQRFADGCLQTLLRAIA